MSAVIAVRFMLDIRELANTPYEETAFSLPLQTIEFTNDHTVDESAIVRYGTPFMELYYH